MLVFSIVAFARWFFVSLLQVTQRGVYMRSFVREFLVAAALATGAAYHLALVIAFAAVLT